MEVYFRSQLDLHMDGGRVNVGIELYLRQIYEKNLEFQ